MSIEQVMPSYQLIFCHLLLLPSSIFPNIRLFSNESTLHFRWPMYWNFSFGISPSNEYLGFISFRFDFLTSQHHSSKASILQLSAFFMVQISHPYMMTLKIWALTIHSFVGKVMSILYNSLSSFVLVFLPRSKSLLISWLQSPSTVILEPKKIKSLFPLFPHLFAMKWWDWMSWSLFFERGHL